jgi:hypothetical protein
VTDIQRADPAARSWAIAFVVFGAAAGAALITGAEAIRPDVEAWITEEPARVASRARLVIAGLALAFGAPTLPMTIYLWRLGTRITTEHRFPPAGLRIIRDTVVLHGSAARRRGRLLQVLAVVLVMAMLGVLATLWRLAALLRV